MLSREAENNYWLGRYLERAENIARMISANTNLLMDLPPSASGGWKSLVTITGMEQSYRESGKDFSESNVVRFLVADKNNPASLISSLNFARENARTLRDTLPLEAWVSLNELYHSVNDNLSQALAKRKRFELLKSISRQTWTFSGILHSAMSHTQAYHLLCAGMLIERADMTSRSIESLPADLSGKKQDRYASFDNIRLMSVLKSLSAYQMYWQQVKSQISRDKVVKFLWANAEFPRSVYFCVHRFESHLENLPDNQRVIDESSKVKAFVLSKTRMGLSPARLHKTMDLLQIRLGRIHAALNKNYFNY